jgi:hypothetical protein
MTAYYNGKKTTVEQASIRHDIFCKLKLNLPLTAKERATYLLLIANDEQVKEFLRKEKEQER